jgi:signal transduction histidine kinase
MCDRLEASQQQLRVVTAQRLLAVEKLRRQDRLRTIGQLASEVAHELGTPLNVVSGRAGQIASGRLSAQEAADTAQIIKQQSLRMARIVRQLLDFARPPSLDKSELDLLETARQVISLLEPIARQRHVELRLESAGGVAASADAGRLEQVLVNLLNNAMDAMPRGGTVSVSLHLCESAVKPGSRLQRSNLVRIDVRDQGEGIAEDHLEQLFEPFFTTKEAGHGSGLGLSIAQGIMKEQGGWIEVESERGKGTCFSIYLPAKEERAA